MQDCLKKCVFGFEVSHQSHLEQADDELIPRLPCQGYVCIDESSSSARQPHGKKDSIRSTDPGAVSSFSNCSMQSDLCLEPFVSGEGEELGCRGYQDEGSEQVRGFPAFRLGEPLAVICYAGAGSDLPLNITSTRALRTILT